MTFQDRLDAYAATFGTRYPDSVPRVSPTGRWLLADWILGQDYRGRSSLYGAFPPRFLERLLALFPDVERPLHLFSGSLGPTVAGVRVDLVASRHPTVQGHAQRLPFRTAAFDFCVADPPYTPADCRRYGTPPVNKRLVLREVARVVRPGGYLAWLDTSPPMHRKSEWHRWGKIDVERSVNHRVRVCCLFTRIGPVAAARRGTETSTSPTRLF